MEIQKANSYLGIEEVKNAGSLCKYLYIKTTEINAIP